MLIQAPSMDKGRGILRLKRQAFVFMPALSLMPS